MISEIFLELSMILSLCAVLYALLKYKRITKTERSLYFKIVLRLLIADLLYIITNLPLLTYYLSDNTFNIKNNIFLMNLNGFFRLVGELSAFLVIIVLMIFFHLIISSD